MGGGENLPEVLSRLEAFAGHETADSLAVLREVWGEGAQKGYLTNEEIHRLLRGAHALGVAGLFIDALAEENQAP